MKPDRNFTLNLVAAMAMLLCFMTSQVEVTAISRTVCIISHCVHSSATSLQGFTTDFIPFQTVKTHDHEPTHRFRRQTSHKNRGLVSLLSDYISEVNIDTTGQEDSDADTLQLILPYQTDASLINLCICLSAFFLFLLESH
jgi:hypothetical protein